VIARGSFLRYGARHIVTGAITLLVVTVVVFVAIHLVPGDYADIVLGQFATPAARARLATEYGLDDPLPVQYVQWLQHAVTGDLGHSMSTGEPIMGHLQRRLPVTGELALLALAFTLLLGLPLAILAALARSAPSRAISRLAGAVAMSVPDFVLGSVVLYLFSRYALGLRAGGYVAFGDDPVGNLRTMLLPALTLGVFGLAMVVRTGRDAVNAVLSAPHVTAAIARGETLPYVVRHHVLRNAAIPVVTVVAVYVGYLMGGAVIVENLFSLPGLGQAVLSGVNGRDYAIVQGVVLVGAAAFIAINTIADLSYGLIDPRVREGSRT
jgi:peptide/nickel transport system permease protein